MINFAEYKSLANTVCVLHTWYLCLKISYLLCLSTTKKSCLLGRYSEIFINEMCYLQTDLWTENCMWI